MSIAIFSGTANVALAEAVAGRLGRALGQSEICRFPDTELHVEIGESVRGRDVYVVQPTSPPVDEHLMELLQIADACLRAGAARVTAVIPYFGYARQDRRAHGRESVAASLVAQMIEASGVIRLVAVDLHSAADEAFFRIPVEHLTAAHLLADALRPHLAPNAVLVAPDLGAAKLAERYGALLDLPVAIVHKQRVSGRDVEAREVTGDVAGRGPLVIDDMVTTAGTVLAAYEAVMAAGAVAEVAVAATHGLLAGPAIERLRQLPLRRLVFTDSVRLPTDTGLPIETVSIAPLLAEAIERLHDGHSLADLVLRH